MRTFPGLLLNRNHLPKVMVASCEAVLETTDSLGLPEAMTDDGQR